MNCKFCGASFETSRSDKFYCSKICVRKNYFKTYRDKLLPKMRAYSKKVRPKKPKEFWKRRPKMSREQALQIRRENDRERYKLPEERLKQMARCTANNAIISGKIKRECCTICLKEPAEMHHDDYSKPLDVRWLCKPHHAAYHASLRRISFMSPIEKWFLDSRGLSLENFISLVPKSEMRSAWDTVLAVYKNEINPNLDGLMLPKWWFFSPD